MNALLVRVAADLSAARWNGPVDLRSGEFVYVPIIDYGPFYPGLETPYDRLASELGGRWPRLPAHLSHLNMHLDPDFDNLTYGDCGRRASQISRLHEDDVLVFFAGLRHVCGASDLVYAIIGLYVIKEIVLASTVPHPRWGENAHTRRIEKRDDIVVRAKPGVSGRLERCLPIGEYRNRAYRVRNDLLSAWGGLRINNGYLQRSAYLPPFINAEAFYQWFQRQRVPLVQSNRGRTGDLGYR